MAFRNHAKLVHMQMYIVYISHKTIKALVLNPDILLKKNIHSFDINLVIVMCYPIPQRIKDPFLQTSGQTLDKSPYKEIKPIPTIAFPLFKSKSFGCFNGIITFMQLKHWLVPISRKDSD